MKIIIRDYRVNEGRYAAGIGYTGPNPYPECPDSAALWQKGFDQVA